MGIIGYRLSSGSGGWESVERNVKNVRAYSLSGAPNGIQYVTTAPLYITHVGAWMRRDDSGNGKRPRVWFAIYEGGDTGSGPGRLLGYTGRVDVGNNGQEVSAPIQWVNPILGGPAGSVRLPAQQRIFIAFKLENEMAEFATIGPSASYYFRSVGAEGSPPLDPFTSQGDRGGKALALFALTTENLAPAAFQDAPANAAALNPNAVIFTVRQEDAMQTAPYYDRMTQFQIEVTTSINVLLWDATFDATPSERLNRTAARLYQGLTLLEPGTTYRWRVRTSDDSYTWSPWTGYRTFTINPQGQVTTDGAPTGKLDNDASAITYNAKWHHPTGLAMNRATLKILRAQDLSTFKSATRDYSPTVASTAAPGTPFTFPASLIGALPPGYYAYTLEGRSTDGQFSPPSAPRLFNINFPPTTPSNLQPPTSAQVVSSYPLLEWNISDPDTDEVFGIDGDSQVEITRVATGAVNTYATSNYNPATGKAWLQLSSTHIPAAGLYLWRVRGRDTSAGSQGIGGWSPYQQINYQAGPVVTITSPSYEGTLTAAQPTVTATINQDIARYEVRLYDVDQALPRASSGQVTVSPADDEIAFTFPAGWVRNNLDYDVEIAVWTALNAEGRSLRVPFRVEFAPAEAPLGFEAEPTRDRWDPEAQTSTVVLSWGITQMPPGEFGGYNVYRRRATDGPDDWTLLRTLGAPGQTTWRDYWAPGNVMLVYGLSQMQRVGQGDQIDIVESPIVEASAELNLIVPVLNSVYDPQLRWPVMWLDSGLRGKTERPSASYVTWGSNNKATQVTTPVEFDTRTVDLSVTLRTDDRGSLFDHVAALEDLVRPGHPLLYRYPRSEEDMYCSKETWSWGRGTTGTRDVSIQLRETDFTPGAAGGS